MWTLLETNKTRQLLIPFLVPDCLTCQTVIDMAANGASCEQPQKRAGPKDKQNGKSAGSFLLNF